MNQTKIISLSKRLLGPLESFIPAEPWAEAFSPATIPPEYVQPGMLEEGDILLGAYFNAPTNFILVTPKQLHWVHKGEMLCLPYNAIQKVDEPRDEELEFEITTHAARRFAIPVENSTDEEPDIWAIWGFLSQIVYWPFRTRENFDLAKKIQSADDLAEFLRKQQHTEAHIDRSILDALQRGFPDSELLEKLQIGEGLINRADIWRLMALSIMAAVSRGD